MAQLNEETFNALSESGKQLVRGIFSDFIEIKRQEPLPNYGEREVDIHLDQVTFSETQSSPENDRKMVSLLSYEYNLDDAALTVLQDPGNNFDLEIIKRELSGVMDISLLESKLRREPTSEGQLR